MSGKRGSLWRQLSWSLCKPEYVCRPGQAFRRVRRALAPRHRAHVVNLPWGLALGLAPRDMIARSILRNDVFDLVLSESVWRLLDPDELALDIGANIGYVTSIMAARVGPPGAVMSFEPHPVLAEELRGNVERWGGSEHTAPVTVRSTALSDHSGSGELMLPSDWERNRGRASVRTPGSAAPDTASRCTITLERLDDVLGSDVRVGVAKLDVEGHELSVLRGAESLLRRGAVRDIVFEDFGEYPTPPMRLLEAHGYTIFSLAKEFRGPRLGTPDRRGVFWRNPPNYLATRDSTRASARMSARGWAVLAGA